jgi:hypothetical protein
MGSHRDVVAKVNSMLADHSMAPLTKFLACKQFLLDTKVGRIEKVHSRDMLCHRSNRGGQGINAYNAHKNLAKVHKAGANISLLNQATCVEMHPVTSPQHMLDLQWNRDGVVRAKGMLAEVSGSERFQSLATGHSAASCRAANAGCITPYTSIADANGRIDATVLKSASADMKEMLDEGWDFFIVPHWLPEECPEFCHLCQSALNASNAIHSVQNEVETGVALVEELQFCGNDWKSAIDACSATQPCCVEYMEVVAKFVKDFGGCAPDYDMIKFLGGFSKDVGVSIMLGSEFTAAITNIEFQKSLQSYKYLRCAMVATQLTSQGQKVKDNIGKLLTVTEVNALKGKEKIQIIAKVERALQEAWRIVSSHQASKKVSDSQAYGLFGRCCMRLILHVFKKEKHGLDQTVFKTMDEVIDTFSQEVDMALGRLDDAKITATGDVKAVAEAGVPAGAQDDATAAGAKADATAAGAKADAKAGDKVEAADDVSTAIAVAKRKFSLFVDKYYQNKTDHPNKVFKLSQFDDKGATFTPCDMFGRKVTKVVAAVEFDKLKNWTSMPPNFKASLVFSLGVDDFVKPASLDVESTRAQLWIKLQELHAEHPVEPNDVIFGFNPCQIFAGRDFVKGELALVPVTDSITKICKAPEKPDSAAALCNMNGLQLQISAPSKQPFIKFMAGELKEDALTKDKPLLAPYWWVHQLEPPKAGEADKQKTINLKLQKLGSLFWCYVNTKSIKKYELLCCTKEKAKAKK